MRNKMIYMFVFWVMPIVSLFGLVISYIRDNILFTGIWGIPLIIFVLIDTQTNIRELLEDKNNGGVFTYPR